MSPRWLRLAAVLSVAMAAVSAAPVSFAQTRGRIPVEAGSSAAVDAVLADARGRGLDRLPFPQLVQATATLPALLGKPYTAGTLDRAPDAETLYVSLDGFDCVTYAETVLALARTLALRGDAETYARELASLRYRHGGPAYCERLHYFTDWIRSNAARGAVDEVTAAVAGNPARLAFHELPAGVDFMSRHAEKLPALAGSAQRRLCIAAMEGALAAKLARNQAGTTVVAYVPAAVLIEADAGLEGGDLLALVAEAPGLDVIHLGLVLDGGNGGSKRVVNASSRAGKVTIAPDLRSFFASSPRARGALVVRPLVPAAAAAATAGSP